MVRLCIIGFIETPHRFSRKWQNPATIVAQASLTAFQEYCRKPPSSLREKGQQLLLKAWKFEKCSLAVTFYKIVKGLLREQISALSVLVYNDQLHRHQLSLQQLEAVAAAVPMALVKGMFKKKKAWYQPVDSTILPALKQKYILNTFCYFNLFLSIAFNSASLHQKGNELQVPACLMQQTFRSARSLQKALQKLQ